MTSPIVIAGRDTPTAPALPAPVVDETTDDMLWIAGGECQIGSDVHYPDEKPAHRRSVDGFWIDRYPVTNARFAEFVAATGHVTVAERAPDPAD